MNTPVDLSTLVETHLRNRIREHARLQPGYDARLYDLWDEWNAEFFGGLMVPPLVMLTDPGHTHRYGCCTSYSGLAGIKSAIKIRESILQGTCLELKHGSRSPKGCRLFLEDVLMHEMVHQFHFEVTGETDAAYSGHGPAFSAKANEIGAKLGLSPVGRTCKKRDCKAKGLPSPSQWPHNVRDRAYYKGAYAPREKKEEDVRTSTDSPLEVMVRELAGRWGVEAVYEAALALQVEKWEKEECWE